MTAPLLGLTRDGYGVFPFRSKEENPPYKARRTNLCRHADTFLPTNAMADTSLVTPPQSDSDSDSHIPLATLLSRRSINRMCKDSEPLQSSETPSPPQPSWAARTSEESKVIYCFKRRNNEWSTYAELATIYNKHYPRQIRKNGKPIPDDDQSRIRSNCNAWNRIPDADCALPDHDPLCNRVAKHAVCQQRTGTTRRYRVAPKIAKKLGLVSKAKVRIGKTKNPD